MHGDKVAVKKSTKTSKTKEPKTMDELLAMAKSSVPSFEKGQLVEAELLEKTNKSATFDIGGKSEGMVAEKSFKESKGFLRTLDIGAKVTAKVLVPETRDGFTILSLRDAAKKTIWERLEESIKEAKPVSVLVNSASGAGLNVEFSGMQGFVPASQLGRVASKNRDNLVGTNINVLVVDIVKDANKVVFSEKQVSEKEELAKIKKALNSLKEGDVYDGVVKTIENFGVFVEISVGEGKTKTPIEGLVHVSELSWKKVEKPENFTKLGNKMKVKVIGLSQNRLALSAKQAEDDPWETEAKKYKKDDKLKGKVTRRSDFGTFVELTPGVEGLVHITKIPPGIRHEKGDIVDVYIEEIDMKARKIGLGIVLTAKPLGYK